MKKTILAVIVSVWSLTAIGQVPQYFNSWLFPEAVESGCFTVPVIGFDPRLCGWANSYGGGIQAWAQPYFIDSTMLIKGVAMIGTHNVHPDSLACYFQIHEAYLDNVVVSVRFDTFPRIHNTPPWTGDNGYVEVLFDNLILVSASKFYTVVTTPYQWPYSSYSVVPKCIGHHPDLYNCPISELPSILRSGKWEDADVISNFEIYPATVLIFPILDTTPITQCQFDATSIDDTTNSTITLEVITSEHGFPLPHTIGFVFDANPNNLNLNNPNIVYYPYDTNQNFYSWTLPYSYLLCNTTYYYRSFVITQLDTIFSDINSFIKQCSSGLDGVIGNDVLATLSPNPADKEITITTAITMQKVEITNATGQKVYEQEVKTNSITVDVSNFAKGNYVAKLHTDKGVTTKKFVVE
ncbi:MAG: T9SS type A sorting domain-containing protein [Bacteroidales bacterium]|jgi:hypothetical protein|nr:T9SS type A sorting domain-containing protein [Bacteroidales bacterium]